MSFSWGVLTGRYGVLSQSWSPRSIPLLSPLSLRCGIDFPPTLVPVHTLIMYWVFE